MRAGCGLLQCADNDKYARVRSCDLHKNIKKKKTVDCVLICVSQTGLCMATYRIYSNATKDLDMLTVTAHVPVYLMQTRALW